MNDAFLEALYAKHRACRYCPPNKEIKDFVEGLISLLFPEFGRKAAESFDDFSLKAKSLQASLEYLLAGTPDIPDALAAERAAQFFAHLPEIHQHIEEDVHAMYSGDPAARSHTEVIRSYPGFYAIASYRIAHKLSTIKVELLPRIITEIAHSRTGIDIHPNAQIGRHFCIDHGTGVVIGETTVIGNHVKIYQGVTLGGLSVNKTDATIKRHPTIEDHVVIYAGATILGGDTVVGKGSVIGGNVWLTKSVPPNTKVYYKAAMTDQSGNTDLIEFRAS